jgi:hypothetical protein
MRSPTVGVGVLYELFRNTVASSMMRVIEVPVATENHTATISIAGMVADRTHLLRLTCFEDVITVHDSTYLHSVDHVTLPGMLGLEILSSLDTVRVTITVPIPTHPLVSVPSVHQRPMAMATSVEESTLDHLHWYLVPAIMAWMREVPAATNRHAPAICVVSVITDRLHSLGPANL